MEYAGGKYGESTMASNDTKEIARLKRAQKDLLGQKATLNRKVKDLRIELALARSCNENNHRLIKVLESNKAGDSLLAGRKLENLRKTSLAKLIWIREKLMEHDILCDYNEEDWILAIDHMIQGTAAQYEIIDWESSDECTDPKCQGDCGVTIPKDSIESIKEKVDYDARTFDNFSSKYNHTLFGEPSSGVIPF